ncbi:MAG: hypothetical protein R2712_09165 [Vicinamibacterales bacterium]
MTRRSRLLLLATALAVSAGLGVLAQPRAGRTLDIYFIDTEGGQATLYVTPEGQSLLTPATPATEISIASWTSSASPRWPGSIILLLTHYHGDHYGNLIALTQKVGVGHLYDHGPSAEGAACSCRVRGTRRRRRSNGHCGPSSDPETPSARRRDDHDCGQRQPRALRPVAGCTWAGQPNPACAEVRPREEPAVDDNHNSAGFVMSARPVLHRQPG